MSEKSKTICGKCGGKPAFEPCNDCGMISSFKQGSQPRKATRWKLISEEERIDRELDVQKIQRLKKVEACETRISPVRETVRKQNQKGMTNTGHFKPRGVTHSVTQFRTPTDSTSAFRKYVKRNKLVVKHAASKDKSRKAKNSVRGRAGSTTEFRATKRKTGAPLPPSTAEIIATTRKRKIQRK